MTDRPSISGPLALEDIRERAVGGAAVLLARGGLMMVMGFGGNLVLARLLVPRDFGLVAVGSVLIIVGRLMTDGGIGAALIRGRRSPSRTELESVLGLQLLFTLVFSLAATAIGAPFGTPGLVTALMVASLPITALRLPATIVLERQLSYRTLATVDLAEGLSYYVAAIAGVAAGLGAWGMAGGFIVRAVLGVLTMAMLGPLGFLRPRWSWVSVHPILGFGVRYQAISVMTAVRDQGLNVGIGAIAGIGVLGIWTLGYRILQIPYLLIVTVLRVWFPVMSRLLDAGEDPRSTIERGLGVVAVCTGLVVVAVVGGAPALVPQLLGQRWHEVASLLLWSGLALTIGAPVSSTVTGYLLAAGKPGTLVRAVMLQTLAWFLVAFPLLRLIGPAGIGIGWVVAEIVHAWFIGHAAASLSGARVARALRIPLCANVIAGAAGWTIASAVGGVWGGILGSTLGVALVVAIIGALHPNLLREIRRIAVMSARASVRAPGPIATGTAQRATP